MSRVKLGDIVMRVKDYVDKDNTDLIYYVGGEHFDERSLTITRKGIIKGSTIGPAFSTKFRPGDVLLMSRNPHLRKAGMVDFEGICSDVSYIIRTKDENVIMQRFIPILFQSDLFWNFAEKNKKGSTNFFLNWSDFERFEFDLPNHETQEKLCDTLWAINDTLMSYKDMINQSNELIRSQFIEMFGDIKETVRLGDCCKVYARIGWQALKKDEHLQTGDYMLITGTDFKDNEIDYSTCKYVSKERYEMDKNIILKNDDVLITKDGTIGKVAIVHNLPKPATLNSGIFVVRPDERFVKEYISYVFRGPLFSDFVDKAKTGATIKHLNQGHLVNFEIPVPSIENQIYFADFSNNIDDFKFKLLEGIDKTTNIFNKIVNKFIKEG
jgi:type I restriction enzyme S subunit